MHIQLGQVLIDQGVLTEEQVELAVREQRRTARPFGLICERLFGIGSEAVETAWATQYATLARTINPLTEAIEPAALELVTRRQAWQFRVLPMRFEDQELLIATTQRQLPRALRFVTGVLEFPAALVLASPLNLGEALCRHYPLPGMTPQWVNDEQLDRLLA